MFLTFLVVAVFHWTGAIQGSSPNLQPTVDPQPQARVILQGSDVCIQACNEPTIQ